MGTLRPPCISAMTAVRSSLRSTACTPRSSTIGAHRSRTTVLRCSCRRAAPRNALHIAPGVHDAQKFQPHERAQPRTRTRSRSRNRGARWTVTANLPPVPRHSCRHPPQPGYPQPCSGERRRGIGPETSPAARDCSNVQAAGRALGRSITRSTATLTAATPAAVTAAQSTILRGKMLRSLAVGAGRPVARRKPESRALRTAHAPTPATRGAATFAPRLTSPVCGSSSPARRVLISATKPPRVRPPCVTRQYMASRASLGISRLSPATSISPRPRTSQHRYGLTQVGPTHVVGVDLAPVQTSPREPQAARCVTSAGRTMLLDFVDFANSADADGVFRVL